MEQQGHSQSGVLPYQKRALGAGRTPLPAFPGDRRRVSPCLRPAPPRPELVACNLPEVLRVRALIERVRGHESLPTTKGSGTPLTPLAAEMGAECLGAHTEQVLALPGQNPWDLIKDPRKLEEVERQCGPKSVEVLVSSEDIVIEGLPELRAKRWGKGAIVPNGREGDPWMADETQSLIKLYSWGMDMADVGELLGRSEEACRDRYMDYLLTP